MINKLEFVNTKMRVVEKRLIYYFTQYNFNNSMLSGLYKVRNEVMQMVHQKSDNRRDRFHNMERFLIHLGAKPSKKCNNNYLKGKESLKIEK